MNVTAAMTELAFAPASVLVGLLTRREVSSRELLAVYLGRVERLNPKVDAVVTVDAERAAGTWPLRVSDPWIAGRTRESRSGRARGRFWRLPGRSDGPTWTKEADMAIDETRLQEYFGKAMADAGTLAEAPLKVLGHELGLWRAMAGAGPRSPGEVAARTGRVERFVREWLAAETAAGYLGHDPATGRFMLPDEAAALVADPASPTFFGLLFRDSFSALWGELDRLADAFRTGKGFGWGDHDGSFLAAQAAFTRPFYRTFLADAWVGALEGIPEKLRAGGRVADVGCGWGCVHHRAHARLS